VESRNSRQCTHDVETVSDAACASVVSDARKVLLLYFCWRVTLSITLLIYEILGSIAESDVACCNRCYCSVVRLSVCLSHSCILLRPLDLMSCHFLWSQVTFYYMGAPIPPREWEMSKLKPLVRIDATCHHITLALSVSALQSFFGLLNQFPHRIVLEEVVCLKQPNFWAEEENVYIGAVGFRNRGVMLKIVTTFFAP